MRDHHIDMVINNNKHAVTQAWRLPIATHNATNMSTQAVRPLSVSQTARVTPWPSMSWLNRAISAWTIQLRQNRYSHRPRSYAVHVIAEYRRDQNKLIVMWHPLIIWHAVIINTLRKQLVTRRKYCWAPSIIEVNESSRGTLTNHIWFDQYWSTFTIAHLEYDIYCYHGTVATE